MESVSVEPVFGWYAMIPLAVIMLASLWLTLSNTSISFGGRLTLMLLRLLAALVLLLGWLRPGLISTTEHESSGAIAVLLDQSQSMTLPSETASKNRWQVLQDVWAAIVSASDMKIGQTQIVPYVFDQSLRPVVSDDLPRLKGIFRNAPSGKLTDIGKVLSELQRTQVEPPLRGVIIVSDAAQTVLPPTVEPTRVASQMAQLDQPILMVGIGPRSDGSTFRDVAIEGLPEHFDAFDKKEMNVPVVVRARGIQGQKIQLTMTLRSSGKNDRIVASKELAATSSNQSLSQNVQIIAPEAGEYLLQVDVALSADVNEQITTNNRATAFVTVHEGGARILYLEGEPRFEQKFLKWSLNSSKDFVVDFAWLQEKDRKTWPKDLTKPPANIDLNKYEVIVLGDLDASALAPANHAAIRKRVQEGAGILLMGGYHSFDAGGYGRSLLAPVFPVELDKGRTQPFDAPIDPMLQTSQATRIKLLVDHPITALAPEPENTRMWRELSPLLSINRLGKPKVAPGVQVLATSESNEPILITGEYGSGRVLAFAGDSTYQWWLNGDQQIHKQFWRQAVLWLLQRDSVSEGFVLKLDRRRLTVDETVTLNMDWFGGSEGRKMPDQVKTELSRDGRHLQNVASSPASENRREAKIAGLDQPGLYRAAVTANSEGKEYKAEIAFIVTDESKELAQPAADWQMMANLVSANQSAGGQLLKPEDIGQGIQWLRERQETVKVTTLEKRRLGDAAWDSWIYLIVFCGLMSCEWGLRKSWQLP
jgi:uncharacterized membrane protein